MSEQRFSSGELGGFGKDVDDAVETGRLLQAAIDEAAMSLPAAATGFDAATEARGGLGDRVMAALAGEPAPTATGFLVPLRRRGLLRGLATSVRQAWVGLGGGGRPFGARAAALAYVLVIAMAGAVLTGAATIGAGSLLGLVNPQPTQTPLPTQPLPSPVPPTIEPTLPPTESPVTTAEPSPTPSESPESSDDHGGSGAEPSDDHGGSGGEPSDDHGGGSGTDDSASYADGSDSGSDSGSSTPKPSETPRPTDTPKPTETPH